jgi:hypothetical protein
MVLQVSSDDQKREQGSENNPNVNAHQSRLAAARHPDNRPAALNRQLLLRLPISCRVRKERRYRESINLAVRIEFPPNSTTAWFTSVMAIINNVAMLAIILVLANDSRSARHWAALPLVNRTVWRWESCSRIATESRSFGNRWLPQTNVCRFAPESQAIFCRRRHQPRRPPPANLRL